MKKFILIFCLFSSVLINCGSSDKVKKDLEKLNETRIASAVKCIVAAYSTYLAGDHAYINFKWLIDDFRSALSKNGQIRLDEMTRHAVIAGGMGYVGYLLARYSLRKANHALDL